MLVVVIKVVVVSVNACFSNLHLSMTCQAVAVVVVINMIFV